MESVNDLEPERPNRAGVREEIPDSSGVEGAMVLANAAFPRLKHLGFTRSQVNLWAETYIAENDSGDVESFLAWIREKERSARPDQSSAASPPC